ncbi:MAG TPA: hypothetical protein DCZ94_13920 [Lentisphaeria bacterium]|nr:MAG: hypothetical protein A2X48_03740 [Lentisphaerae bacterium GWF2_49_21]HBC88042.1 hypothetical protein [Lentisphaeria bacterium]
MALIMTVAMLFMLLLMAIAFASTARMWKQAAGNSNDLAVTRLFAESAIQRAIGALRFYSSISGNQYADVISHDEVDSITANRKNFDTLYRIATVSNDVQYDWVSPYDPDAVDAVHWQYVYNGLPGPSDAGYDAKNPKKIIGRIAYVTVAVGGKLDPAACVDHNSTVGSAVNENGASEERNGIYVKEINIQDLDPANATTFLPVATISNFSSANASPAGRLADGERWIDWDKLFSPSKLNITDSIQKDAFRTWFTIDNPADPEAFWVDTDNDGLQDSGELFHRFNLARTDWNAMAVGNIIASPTTYSNAASTYDGNGIKWLNNWTDAGTYSTVTARKNQIASNIKDYSDSDDDVTTDSTTAPTYTGNEKTPYINELALEVQCTTTMINIEGPEKEAHLDFYIRCGGEIINMYGENFSAATTLRMIGTIDFDYHAQDPPDVQHYSGTYDRTFDLTAIGSSSYKFTWDVQPFLVTKTIICLPPHKVWVDNLKVGVNTSILTYNGKFADCAKPDAAGEFSNTFLHLVERDNHGIDTTYFEYQVDDPRQNLNSGDWPQATCPVQQDPAISPVYVYTGTIDAINSGVTCTTSGDAETGSTPPTISTAFIRNAPMKSPWELGCIHRGGKWETINLLTYNETDGHYGITPTAGGGTFASGDANILDQVKMTGNTETYGLVSINASTDSVLKALIAKIRAGVPWKNNGSDGTSGTADDNSPGSRNNGTELTYNTNVTNIASAISGSAYRQFKTRGQIVKVSKLSDGTEATQTKNATKEEIIGKFINLTKATSIDDTIVIIALAQAIKDVGDGKTISKDLDANGTIGSADEATATVKYDINGDGDITDTISETFSNCQYGTYNQYADEILAEQKVLAVVSRNPVSGKWKIIKFMYLED